MKFPLYPILITMVAGDLPTHPLPCWLLATSHLLRWVLLQSGLYQWTFTCKTLQRWTPSPRVSHPTSYRTNVYYCDLGCYSILYAIPFTQNSRESKQSSLHQKCRGTFATPGKLWNLKSFPSSMRSWSSISEGQCLVHMLLWMFKPSVHHMFGFFHGLLIPPLLAHLNIGRRLARLAQSVTEFWHQIEAIWNVFLQRDIHSELPCSTCTGSHRCA